MVWCKGPISFIIQPLPCTSWVHILLLHFKQAHVTTNPLSRNMFLFDVTTICQAIHRTKETGDIPSHLET